MVRRRRSDQAARGAQSSATNPTWRCVASQKGFVLDRPHRQRTTDVPGGSSNGTPSASTIETGPVILRGPFSRTVIVTSLTVEM